MSDIQKGSDDEAVMCFMRTAHDFFENKYAVPIGVFLLVILVVYLAHICVG